MGVASYWAKTLSWTEGLFSSSVNQGRTSFCIILYNCLLFKHLFCLCCFKADKIYVINWSLTASVPIFVSSWFWFLPFSLPLPCLVDQWAPAERGAWKFILTGTLPQKSWSHQALGSFSGAQKHANYHPHGNSQMKHKILYLEALCCLMRGSALCAKYMWKLTVLAYFCISPIIKFNKYLKAAERFFYVRHGWDANSSTKV